MGNKFILLLEPSRVSRLMCLILAAVGNIHNVQTSDTPFQKLSKKQGRSLRKESPTAKARYPCDFTFPERAIYRAAAVPRNKSQETGKWKEPQSKSNACPSRAVRRWTSSPSRPAGQRPGPPHPEPLSGPGRGRAALPGRHCPRVSLWGRHLAQSPFLHCRPASNSTFRLRWLIGVCGKISGMGTTGLLPVWTKSRQQPSGQRLTVSDGTSTGTQLPPASPPLSWLPRAPWGDSSSSSLNGKASDFILLFWFCVKIRTLKVGRGHC